MSALICGGGLRPGRGKLGVAAYVRELRGAVERHPAHQLRRYVVPRLAARLPDALIGVLPDRRGALGLCLHERPEAPRDPLAAAAVQQDRVERRAEDVVLALVERAVADADGIGAVVPGEILAHRFGQFSATVDPVHDLQSAIVVAVDVGHELHELVGLPIEQQVVQGPQQEGRVADPGVAVVPVALAPWRLGQRGGERRDGRPRGHVGEPLDRQRGALDQRPELVVGNERAREPIAPEHRRRVELPEGFLGGGWHARFVAPGERAEDRLAVPQDVPGSGPAAFDAEQHVGLEPECLIGPGDLAAMAVGADRPLPGNATVVEGRLAQQIDLDRARDAAGRAHERVVGIFVGGRSRVRCDGVRSAARPHRQGVAHHQPAGGRLPRRDERVGSGLIDPVARDVDPERREPEAAGATVEQRPEHAR